MLDYFIALIRSLIIRLCANMEGSRHMIKTCKNTILALGAALLLTACQEQNPLLGEWSLVKTAELNVSAYKLAQISGNGRITFEEEQMRSGKHAMEVSYSVSGNEVTVHYQSGEKNTYLVEDGKHFVFEIPKAGKFKYVRVN